MARAGLTQQSAIEAGIAADLAAAPDRLPSAISGLSDQAAIFASNNTNAFMFTGSADADSENTNFGEALATKAVEKLIELEERRRREDDPAGDAGMIAELAARQREDLAEMTRVTYSDGKFHMFGMDIDVEDMDASVAETLESIDDVAARHNLDAQQTAQLTSLLIAYQNAGSPEEKAEILGQIVEVQPEVAREMADDAAEASAARNQNELQAEEVSDANINDIENDFAFELANLEVADTTQTAELAVTARNSLSVAGETDLASSFAADFSSAPDFNESAGGQVQVAEATLAQADPVASGPALTA